MRNGELSIRIRAVTLMAHGHWTRSVAWHYTEMGRLVADAGKQPWDELTAEYGAQLIEGVAVMGCK